MLSPEHYNDNDNQNEYDNEYEYDDDYALLRESFCRMKEQRARKKKKDAMPGVKVEMEMGAGTNVHVNANVNVNGNGNNGGDGAGAGDVRGQGLNDDDDDDDDIDETTILDAPHNQQGGAGAGTGANAAACEDKGPGTGPDDEDMHSSHANTNTDNENEKNRGGEDEHGKRWLSTSASTSTLIPSASASRKRKRTTPAKFFDKGGDEHEVDFNLDDLFSSSSSSIGFEWNRKEQKTFDERLVELHMFKIKHGHLRVTERYDLNLANFCQNMRTARRYGHKRYNTMRITPERIKALDDLGFVWHMATPPRSSGPWFDTWLEQLKAFKETHGHLHVTQTLDKGLATFCSKVRLAMTKHTDNHNKGDESDGEVEGDTLYAMTEEKVKKLNDIGFEWQEQEGNDIGGGEPTKFSFEQRLDRRERSVEQRGFEQYLEELKAFKVEHGHLHVTNAHDQKLASLCSQLRCSRANPSTSTGSTSTRTSSGNISMTDERIKALDELGFCWERSRERYTFDQRVDQLKAFKEKHGHLNVTPTLDKSLAQYCATIRSSRNRIGGSDESGQSGSKHITEERIKVLDDIGFKWNSRNRATFEDRLNQLKAFKEEHGHLNVTMALDKSLAQYCTNIRWARSRREGYRESSNKGMLITEERIKALDDIGFRWNSHDQGTTIIPFDDRLNQLRAFKEKHGHLNVTLTLGKDLAQYCSKVRFDRQMGTFVSEERIKALDDIGFKWNAQDPGTRTSFEQRVDQLKAFKEKHGHLNVTAVLDKSLAHFCNNIRWARSRREGSRENSQRGMLITEERIKLLDDIGFKWNVQNQSTSTRTSFEDRLNQLKAFKEKHGHLNVTLALDRSLAQYCTNIRSSRNRNRIGGGDESSNKGMLITEERIKALDDIGFKWNAHYRQRTNRTTFEDRLNQLRAFKEKHGHLNVTMALDKGLAQYCTNIRWSRNRREGSSERSNKGMLITEERIKALDDIGFKWNA